MRIVTSVPRRAPTERCECAHSIGRTRCASPEMTILRRERKEKNELPFAVCTSVAGALDPFKFYHKVKFRHFHSVALLSERTKGHSPRSPASITFRPLLPFRRRDFPTLTYAIAGHGRSAAQGKAIPKCTAGCGAGDTLEGAECAVHWARGATRATRATSFDSSTHAYSERRIQSRR